MKKIIIAAVAAALTLTGCGESSSSSGDSSSTTTQYNVTLGTGSTGQTLTYDCGGAVVDNLTINGTNNQIEMKNCDVQTLIYNADTSAIAFTGTSDMQTIQYSGSGQNYVYAPQFILDRIPDTLGFVETAI
ncbi:hypothetical protein WCX49_06725 [Sulfurimonas sp. HSL-1656]|uniref:hypothetical protein n=1 Tax=Thiomicrolovo subterrani TaxID=3131934 RepID=UPI0031F8D957